MTLYSAMTIDFGKRGFKNILVFNYDNEIRFHRVIFNIYTNKDYGRCLLGAWRVKYKH